MTESVLADKATAREMACQELVRQARAIELIHAGERSALPQIRDLMIDFVARHAQLLDPDDFELPVAHSRFHKLVEGGEVPYGFYLGVTRPGKEAAPHMHGLWGITVGISGREINHFWRRTDDGSAPGRAALEHLGSTEVALGTGMTLAGDEIHSTETLGDEPSWMLHLYERPFSGFPSLLFFHPERGTVRKLPAHAAKTIRG